MADWLSADYEQSQNRWLLETLGSLLIAGTRPLILSFSCESSTNSLSVPTITPTGTQSSNRLIT
jgi:hypothetical protein